MVCLLLAVLGCGSSSGPTAPGNPDLCAGYPAWESSVYVLPYPVGSSYIVAQANCSGFSHSGLLRYAYDFAMPIGTSVTAARAGVVTFVREEFPDGDFERFHSNLVQVQHDDGSYAVYEHLTQQGALVAVGDVVVQGQEIGLSGNTGFTLGLPQLHLDIAPCFSWEQCGTLAVTFRNTDANPTGLEVGRAYGAF